MVRQRGNLPSLQNAVLSMCMLFALAVLTPGCQPSPETVAEEASIMEERGDFSGAERFLRGAIERAETPEARTALEFEFDRLQRIRMDYPYDRERLWEIISRAVRDVTRNELDSWIQEGRLDRRIIDGREVFVTTSRSNLFWRYPDIADRRIEPPENTAFERALLENARAILAASDSLREPYVLPKSFAVSMTITVLPETVPPGSLVRAWLPVPRRFAFQSDFRLLTSSPEARVDDEASPIRSAFMERPANEDGGTDFHIEYTYTHAGIRFKLDESRSVVYSRTDAEVNGFLEEGPHVNFTKEMRTISEEIVAGEENPLRKARALYTWISENIQYSYALEYSTVRDLGAYCLNKRYGDCGQAALLFITLCRLNGIPARWQSGWFTFPGGKTIHDWAEIYLEPWGWVPVDPYMGVFATQYLRSLSAGERREIRDFYFGGLDQYRIAANSDHSQTLRPPKRSMRSDNVDFQRGELETDDSNIYFDKYTYRLSVEEQGRPE